MQYIISKQGLKISVNSTLLQYGSIFYEIRLIIILFNVVLKSHSVISIKKRF